MNKTKIPIWTVSGGLHLDLARLWYQIKHQFIKQKMVLSGLLFSKRVHWVSRAVTDFWSRRGHEKKEVVEKHLNLTLPFYQQCSTTDSSQTNPFPNGGQKTFELEVTRAEMSVSITFNLSSTLRPTIVGPCITTWSIFGQNQWNFDTKMALERPVHLRNNIISLCYKWCGWPTLQLSKFFCKINLWP